MKKNVSTYFRILTIFLCALSVGIFHSCCLKKSETSSTSQAPLHRAHLIVTDDGKPAQLTYELLAALNLKHDGTLQNIVEVTQKNLLRPVGKERWQSPESVYQENADKIIPILKQLGLLQEVQAEQKDYRYGILLGATVTNVRKRLAFLIQEWNRGVRVDELVILAGQRILDPDIESVAVLYDRKNGILPIKQSWQDSQEHPKTETEMMRMVLEQAELPEGLAKIPCTFIDAPMQKTADGLIRRPTTGDTVNAWLEKKPNPDSCLVVSCQPYVTYQDSVMRTLMPASFSLETIGARVSEGENLATLLDTVARILYQEYQLVKVLEKK
ncbi:hypothetical protein JST56_04120 [Candidatus Dependentiae bacterium]|nr:hypothetical protein [Candidatus Dependentiae bacterium]